MDLTLVKITNKQNKRIRYEAVDDRRFNKLAIDKTLKVLRLGDVNISEDTLMRNGFIWDPEY